MTNLRTTVIAKTDIVGSTPRLAGLSEPELNAFLKQHKEFIADIVGVNEGTIIRREGDSFWIVFPSVTTAVQAAIEMHQQLKVMQAGRAEVGILWKTIDLRAEFSHSKAKRAPGDSALRGLGRLIILLLLYYSRFLIS